MRHTTKGLRLNKETLRQLSRNQLVQVAGGVSIDAPCLETQFCTQTCQESVCVCWWRIIAGSTYPRCGAL